MGEFAESSDGKRFLELVCSANAEGIPSKRIDAAYLIGVGKARTRATGSLAIAIVKEVIDQPQVHTRQACSRSRREQQVTTVMFLCGRK